MKLFSKINLNNMTKEGTPHGAGLRKMVASKKEVPSKHFEAYTQGFLASGEIWEMHEHADMVEICLVTRGTGKVRDGDRNEAHYKPGDRFIFPPNTKHEIENDSEGESEFFFLRVRR